MEKQSKYNEIVKAIIQDIDQGILQARDRLPSEKELQDRFGVSRVTVRKAIDVLIDEGYVVRDYRKGTFISERITYKSSALLSLPYCAAISRLRSFTPSMR